jgi:hypothetical protein
VKSESGQGLVEYALITVLVGVVIVVCLAVLRPAQPALPPAINAPLLEVTRWCESQAYDTYTTQSFVMIGEMMTLTTQTHRRDNPDKFIACMKSYEYEVGR